MRTFEQLLSAFFFFALFIGGIACIIGGLDSRNDGAPIAGAALMIAAIYFNSRPPQDRQ